MGGNEKLNGPFFFLTSRPALESNFHYLQTIPSQCSHRHKKNSGPKVTKDAESIIIFPLHLAKLKITDCSLQSKHSCKMTQILLATRWHFFLFIYLFLKRNFGLAQHWAAGAMSSFAAHGLKASETLALCCKSLHQGHS